MLLGRGVEKRGHDVITAVIVSSGYLSKSERNLLTPG